MLLVASGVAQTFRSACPAGLLYHRQSASDAQGTETTTAGAREGVYSVEQAARGARIYDDKCGACHKVEQFTGPEFLLAWNGQRADALFNLIRNTMPTESPASLKRQAYADIVAYLLQANGLPAGKTELGGTDDALKRVVIEAPRNSKRPKGR